MSRLGLNIFVALVATMVLAACPAEPDPTPSPPPPPKPGPYLGDTLKLSGQMHTRNFDPAELDSDTFDNPLVLAMVFMKFFTYTEAGKDMALQVFDGGMGGSGKIQNGQLSYSIGKPADQYLQPVDELFSSIGLLPVDIPLPNIEINAKDAQAALLLLLIADNPDYSLITREKAAFDIFNFRLVMETVSYVYVDKNVTITAEEFTYTDNDIMDFPVGLTVKNINLELRKGWNAVKSDFTATFKPLSLDFSKFEINGDLSISSDNPSSLYWVLSSGNDELLPTP
jgi:hypothetical protein